MEYSTFVWGKFPRLVSQKPTVGQKCDPFVLVEKQRAGSVAEHCGRQDKMQ